MGGIKNFLIIKFVMTSAVEEEIGEMYINAREDVQQIISGLFTSCTF